MIITAALKAEIFQFVMNECAGDFDLLTLAYRVQMAADGTEVDNDMDYPADIQYEDFTVDQACAALSDLYGSPIGYALDESIETGTNV